MPKQHVNFVFWLQRNENCFSHWIILFAKFRALVMSLRQSGGQSYRGSKHVK